MEKTDSSCCCLHANLAIKIAHHHLNLHHHVPVEGHHSYLNQRYNQPFLRTKIKSTIYTVNIRFYLVARRREFFFRTWSEASLAHLKKQLCRTLVPSHGVIKVIEAKILNLYKSLNSPQVKHNYSPINRTSGLWMAKISLSKRLLTTMYEKKFAPAPRRRTCLRILHTFNTKNFIIFVPASHES